MRYLLICVLTGMAALLTVPADAGLLRAMQRSTIRKQADLPKAQYKHRVTVDVQIPMSDGTTLVADLFQPKADGLFPTILMRGPYGRKFIRGNGDVLAGLGYNVLIQDCRGTGDSGGSFMPFVNERSDGSDTVSWIAAQPWFNGDLFLAGPSYLSYTQWAIAVDNPEVVRAIAPRAGGANVWSVFHGSGALHLDLALSWTFITEELRDGRVPLGDIVRLQKTVKKNLLPWNQLPVTSLDREATGATSPYYQRIVAGDPEDEYWSQVDLLADLPRAKAPAYITTGWHDFALEPMLATYYALQEAGQHPYLTIGPYSHSDDQMQYTQLKSVLAWFDKHSSDPTEGQDVRDSPVRYYMYGADEWREADEWPLPTMPLRLHLQPGGTLQFAPPSGGPDFTEYQYDPADPTPAVGGPTLFAKAPTQDNGMLEARQDTLVYTSEPFEQPIEVAGAITARMFVTSDRETADVFVRVNIVGLDGVSVNLTDNLVRVSGLGGEQPMPVDLTLRSTAVRLKPGERFRVVVSSGAHPLFARNFGEGTTADQATATELFPANQQLFHSNEASSFVELPVLADVK